MSLNNRIFHDFLKSVGTTGKSASFENLQTFVWPSVEPLHPNRKPLHIQDPFEVRPKYQTKYSISSRFVCSWWVSFVEFHDLIQSLFHVSVQGEAKEKWAGRKQYFISSDRVISHHSSISKRMKQSGGLLSHAQWPTRLKLDRFFFFSFIDILHRFSILLSYFQDTKCFALNRAHFFKAPLFASSSRQYLRRSGY